MKVETAAWPWLLGSRKTASGLGRAVPTGGGGKNKDPGTGYQNQQSGLTDRKKLRRWGGPDWGRPREDRGKKAFAVQYEKGIKSSLLKAERTRGTKLGSQKKVNKNPRAREKKGVSWTTGGSEGMDFALSQKIRDPPTSWSWPAWLNTHEESTGRVVQRRRRPCGKGVTEARRLVVRGSMGLCGVGRRRGKKEWKAPKRGTRRALLPTATGTDETALFFGLGCATHSKLQTRRLIGESKISKKELRGKRRRWIKKGRNSRAELMGKKVRNSQRGNRSDAEAQIGKRSKKKGQH